MLMNHRVILLPCRQDFKVSHRGAVSTLSLRLVRVVGVWGCRFAEGLTHTFIGCNLTLVSLDCGRQRDPRKIHTCNHTPHRVKPRTFWNQHYEVNYDQLTERMQYCDEESGFWCFQNTSNCTWNTAGKIQKWATNCSYTRNKRKRLRYKENLARNAQRVSFNTRENTLQVKWTSGLLRWGSESYCTVGEDNTFKIKLEKETYNPHSDSDYITALSRLFVYPKAISIPENCARLTDASG